MIPPNKQIFEPSFYEEVKTLQILGNGTRRIAKQLGISRTVVIRLFKELGIKNAKNVKLDRSHIKTKQCLRCQMIKNLSEFYETKHLNGAIYYHPYCKACNTLNCNDYRRDNHDERLKKEREYKAKNCIPIRKNYLRYIKERKKIDIPFKLRGIVSTAISTALRKRGLGKNGSCPDYLPYSFITLEEHLESLFSHPDNLTHGGKVWMTWKNQGKYIPNKWDDTNPDTWVWQLDHIIPHSTFEYKTMDCQEFRDCWALSNLRPLSAKQNVLDGVSKTRHN